MSSAEFMDCAQCGKTCHVSELAQFGKDLVCADCKPLYVQRLREGVPVPASSATGAIGAGALADGELDLGALFSQSWEVYTRNFWRLIGLYAAVVVPFSLVSAIIQALVVAEVMPPEAVGLLILIAALVSGLFLMVSFGGFCQIIAGHFQGREIGLGEAFSLGVNSWSTLFVASLLKGILTFLLFLCLIIPGIIFSVYWSFVPFIAVLTVHTGMDSLNYSKTLVTGRWWRVVGYSLLVGILCAVPQMVVGGVFGAIGAIVPELTPIGAFGEIFNIPFDLFAKTFLCVYFLNLHHTLTKHGRFPNAYDRYRQQVRY